MLRRGQFRACMLQFDQLRFTSHYVGLFWTGDKAASLLNDVARRYAVDAWIYASSQRSFAVAMAKHHGEAVVSFLRSAHESLPSSSSVLGGLLFGSTETPPKKDAYIVRFQFDEFNTAMLRAVFAYKDVYLVCIPDLRELIAIVSTAIGLDLLRGFPAAPPLTGFELVHSAASSQPTKPRHRYDPIESQVSEVLNRSSVAARKNSNLCSRRGPQRWVRLLRLR